MKTTSKISMVRPAEPFRYMAMGSLGTADGMLLRQYHFPNTYHPAKDRMATADDDRLRMWDYNHYNKCFDKHVGPHDCSLTDFAMRQPVKIIKAFLIEVLKADPQVKWTGFRILGTVNHSNGNPIYTLELFANKSRCKTYSGEIAPNVQRPGAQRSMDFDE